MSFSNKVKGCLYGYAIGDALGRGTEFMTRAEVSHRYPDGLRDYSQIIRDAFRSSRLPGEFSGDTEIILKMADSIIELDGVNYMDFARRYKEWFDLQEIEDVDTHMRLVLQDKDFLMDPHGTCKKLYESQGFYEAPNEAMGRAVLLGLWPKDIEKNVTDNCHLTHWDTRSVASGVIVATVANELLWHKRLPEYDHLIGIANRMDNSVIPYLETALHGSLSDFEIDDEETSLYVRKNIGVALWCLWHHTDPGEALYDVISYGGDANANAALATSLLGLRYGVTKLPENLITSLIGAEKIEETSDNLIDALQRADDGHDTDD